MINYENKVLDILLDKLSDAELEFVAEEPRYYFDSSQHRHFINIIESYKFTDLVNRKVPIRKWYQIMFEEK